MVLIIATETKPVQKRTRFGSFSYFNLVSCQISHLPSNFAKADAGSSTPFLITNINS